MMSLKKPKKSLGQNFLMDKNIINKIVKIGNVGINNTVLEIGPGYGSLTKKIAELKPKKLLAIEKDKKISLSLTKKFKNSKNIQIINEDIMNVIKNKKIGENIIVFGNLPYNISTQILAALLLLEKWPPWYSKLILMFQKEVADRITAKVNTKEYGRLSVLCNWRMKVTNHFNVSKNCFFPKPKISSSVLSFEPKKNKFNIKNPKNLEKITRIFFSNRRKMINKNFNKIFNTNDLIVKDLNLNLKKRPGEISNETYYNLTIKYEELFS